MATASMRRIIHAVGAARYGAPATVTAVYLLLKGLALAGILNAYWQIVLDQALITTIGALGLSIIYGFAGQFSLGHAAFFGIGAYTAGVIGRVVGRGSLVWFPVALAAGMTVAAAASFLIGVPILRLKSDYLGIATLGFGVIMRALLNNADKVYPPLGGATGMTGVPQLASFDVIFGLCALTTMVVRNLVYSGYGRSWMALREDELAADAMGIDTAHLKQTAFVLGCALAGLAGALYAHRYPYLHPSSFDLVKSLDFLLIVVLGGLGSITGTLLTSVAFVFMLEILRAILGQAFVDLRGVIYSVILIAMILVRPQGLFAGKEIGMLKPRESAMSKEGDSRAAPGS